MYRKIGCDSWNFLQKFLGTKQGPSICMQVNTFADNIYMQRFLKVLKIVFLKTKFKINL
jgi:hypothetical protein